MTSPLEKLSALRAKSGDAVHVTSAADIGTATTARENRNTFLADRMEAGWTQADIDEYAAWLREDLQDPERTAAAREFWAAKAVEASDFQAATSARQQQAMANIRASATQ